MATIGELNSLRLPSFQKHPNIRCSISLAAPVRMHTTFIFRNWEPHGNALRSSSIYKHPILSFTSSKIFPYLALVYNAPPCFKWFPRSVKRFTKQRWKIWTCVYCLNYTLNLWRRTAMSSQTFLFLIKSCREYYSVLLQKALNAQLWLIRMLNLALA
jgi:hypothetical protein